MEPGDSAMDPGQQFEALMLSRQKPMNDLIPRGDSAVQQFYSGTTIFVTGASGFLGKQLIEKLFRSCDIKKMYVLIRPKKGTSTKDRLEQIKQDVIFDTVRRQKPNFADKVIPVEGDVSNLRLGLKESDWIMLANEVNIIIHVAATVRFDEPLRRATLINVLGTREIILLARDCSKLKCLTHVSTAYTHSTKDRIGQDVLEKFYPCPMSPDLLIDLVTTVDEERINGITQGLIEGWPNTYTFTKALAEELVRRAKDLPVRVVRPPFVTNTYIEPVPGWIDLKACVSGPIGMCLGIAIGVIHILQMNKKIQLSYAPVDLVNNTIIAAGWDMVEKKRKNNKDEAPVYTVTTYGRGNKWGDAYRYFKSDDMTNLQSPKTVWYAWGYATMHDIPYTILTWLVHYIPAYAIDAILDILKLRPQELQPLVKIYTKIYKVSKIYKYFLFHDWNLKDDELKSMMKRMSAEDRIIFNCDVDTVDFEENIRCWAIGLRRYVVKDNLQGTVNASRKQNFFLVVHTIVSLLYGYLIWKVLHLVYSIIMMIF